MKYWKSESWSPKLNGVMIQANTYNEAMVKLIGNTSDQGYTTVIEVEAPKPLIKSPLEKPYRLGKSNKLAILDKNGREVLKIPFGDERLSNEILILLNNY